MSYHIVPVDDLRPHISNGNYCPCKPVLDQSNGETLVIHNSYDGREFAERDAEAESSYLGWTPPTGH